MLISQPLKEACNKSFTDASRSHLLCPSPHPSLTDSSRASHPQPSLSYLIGFTITDISCPSSGQRHVDSGLCPEIKQYAVTGKKTHTQQHADFTHARIHTWQACRDPTSKKTNNGDWKSAFPCGEPVYGTLAPYGLFAVDKIALRTLTTAVCLYGNQICNCCLPLLLLALHHHQSVLEAWRCAGGGFVKSSISCQLKITHILLQTAPGGNPIMLLPSCSSMLLILFSVGNRILGGLSVKGAEKHKRHN